MTFSTFTNAEVVYQRLGVRIVPVDQVIAVGDAVEPSAALVLMLERGRKIAGRSGGEKARSESLIAPVLAEVEALTGARVFSGRSVVVEGEASLVGEFDFALTAPDPGIQFGPPFLTIVEAKRDDFDYGLAQCAAAMVAAMHLNRDAGWHGTVYGAVTNGTVWQLIAVGDSATILAENRRFTLDQLDVLLGALVGIVRASLALGNDNN